MNPQPCSESVFTIWLISHENITSESTTEQTSVGTDESEIEMALLGNSQ